MPGRPVPCISRPWAPPAFWLVSALLGLLAGCSSTPSHPRGEVTIVTVYSTDGAWFEFDGRVEHERTHQKAQDGFGAMLHLTTNRYFIDTFNLSPFLARLEIPESAMAGEKYYALVIFFGAGKDLNGRSYVTFTGRVRDPNNHPYEEYTDAPVFQGPNTAPDPLMRISNSRLTLQFTNASQPGDYTVQIEVTDHIKHVTLKLEQTIRLEEVSSSGRLLAFKQTLPVRFAPDDLALFLAK